MVFSSLADVRRSCRDRLEAHNSRQREKWTVGGRRRFGEGAEGKPSMQRLSMPTALPALGEHLPWSYMDAGGFPIFMDPVYPNAVNGAPAFGQARFHDCKTPPSCLSYQCLCLTTPLPREPPI